MQHRNSQGGEKRIEYTDVSGTKRTIKLDGYVDQPQPLALEFYGCAWHACPDCFPDRETVMPNGKTADRCYKETMAREEIVKQNMPLTSVWECKIREGLQTKTKATEPMRTFFADCPSYGPIDPRDAYFGGRTGPLRLAFDLQGRDDLEISYLDIQVCIRNFHITSMAF